MSITTTNISTQQAPPFRLLLQSAYDAIPEIDRDRNTTYLIYDGTAGVPILADDEDPEFYSTSPTNTHYPSVDGWCQANDPSLVSHELADSKLSVFYNVLTKQVNYVPWSVILYGDYTWEPNTIHDTDYPAAQGWKMSQITIEAATYNLVFNLTSRDVVYKYIAITKEIPPLAISTTEDVVCNSNGAYILTAGDIQTPDAISGLTYKFWSTCREYAGNASEGLGEVSVGTTLTKNTTIYACFSNTFTPAQGTVVIAMDPDIVYPANKRPYLSKFDYYYNSATIVPLSSRARAAPPEGDILQDETIVIPNASYAYLDRHHGSTYPNDTKYYLTRVTTSSPTTTYQIEDQSSYNETSTYGNGSSPDSYYPAGFVHYYSIAGVHGWAPWGGIGILMGKRHVNPNDSVVYLNAVNPRAYGSLAHINITKYTNPIDPATSVISTESLFKGTPSCKFAMIIHCKASGSGNLKTTSVSGTEITMPATYTNYSKWQRPVLVAKYYGDTFNPNDASIEWYSVGIGVNVPEELGWWTPINAYNPQMLKSIVCA